MQRVLTIRSGPDVTQMHPRPNPESHRIAIAQLKLGDVRAEKLEMRGRAAYAGMHVSTSTVVERYARFVRMLSRRSPPRLRRPSVARPWGASEPRPDVFAARESIADPALSIVIVSYNCVEILTACLESLAADDTAPPAEVIVVDNASDDGTVECVTERFAWVRVIANHANVGFAHAMNQGLDTGRGKDFLALNPDTLVPAGAIVKALAELERHPDVGMLGVKLIRPDGTFDHACKRGFPTVSSALYYFLGLSRLFPRSARFARYTAGELGQNETGTVDAINGAFMLVKREAVEDVGPMDERFWLYAEDIDWCHRFWDEGWKVLYWPTVQVIHRKGGSSGDIRSLTLNRAFHRSMWLFYAKHVAPGHPRALSGLVWAGVWTKFGLSALANTFRRAPVHDWSEERTAAGRSATDDGD